MRRVLGSLWRPVWLWVLHRGVSFPPYTQCCLRWGQEGVGQKGDPGRCREVGMVGSGRTDNALREGVCTAHHSRCGLSDRVRTAAADAADYDVYAACCWPQWIPPHERARAVSLTTSGAWQQQQQAQWGPAGHCAACTSSSSNSNNSRSCLQAWCYSNQLKPTPASQPSIAGCIDRPLSGSLLHVLLPPRLAPKQACTLAQPPPCWCCRLWQQQLVLPACCAWWVHWACPGCCCGWWWAERSHTGR